MTLRDLFTDKTLWAKYGDMDVYNDCIDDMASAWCGTQMTKAGLEHYGDGLLSTEIEIFACSYGGSGIECKIDDCPDYSRRWRKIKALFDEAAGYLGVEEYDMWFIDDYDLEEDTEYDPMAGSPDEDAMDRIEMLKDMVLNLQGRLNRAISCIASPLESAKESLEYIGLSEKEIHDWLD